MLVTNFRHIKKWAVRLAITAALICPTQFLYAQNEIVVFSRPETTVGLAICEIERQTQYVFAFDVNALDYDRPVKLSPARITVKEALNQILDSSKFKYVVRNRFISITSLNESKPAFTGKNSNPEFESKHDNYSWQNELTATRELQTPANYEIKISIDQPAVVSQHTSTIEYYSDYKPLDQFSEAYRSLPGVALSLNVLYAGATYTPNISLEIGIGKKSTIGISGSYNPWNRIGTLEKNDKLVHWIVRPQYRYWFCERFNGHFIGADGFFSKYNVSGHDIPQLFKKEFRYEGRAFGFGISYGYHLPLGKRWGLEFNVGLGIAFLNYEQFDCALCSDVMGSYRKTYFGPTQAGVTVVFMIK